MREITLYNDFPRMVGKFRQWVYNSQELNDYINKYNGEKDCFISVYKFTKKDSEKKFGMDAVDPGSAVIDKIFLDFDNKRGYECFCVTRDFLLEKDILFRAHLSGKNSQYYGDKGDALRSVGFHFYIIMENGVVTDSTELRVIHSTLNKIIEKRLKTQFGITVDKRSDRKNLSWDQIDEIIDPHIMGDVSRMARIANTFNVSRGRFCVPLSKEDLFKDPFEMYQLTDKQRLDGNFWIGNKLWKISREMFSEKVKNKYETYNGSTDFVKTTKDQLKKNRIFFPPCINSIIDRNEQGINLYHDERVLLASFLLKVGLTVDDIVEVFSTQPDFNPDITSYQVKSIEEKEGHGYMPASCKTLFDSGSCKKSDSAYHHPFCFRDKPIKNPLNFYKQISKWYEES
jgi:hypothetical protein